MNLTDRVFGYFEDARARTVRVIESRFAVAHVQVFCQASSGEDGPMHLTVEQATKLRDALDLFIKDITCKS